MAHERPKRNGRLNTHKRNKDKANNPAKSGTKRKSKSSKK